MSRSKGDSNKNKFQVTMTFPTKELMEEFCDWMSNSGEQYFGCVDYTDEEFDPFVIDYTRCFPAWGWKEGEPKFIDVYFVDEE